MQNHTFVLESVDKSAWLHPVEDPASVEMVMFAFDGVRFEVCELGGDIAECFLILVASRSSAVHLPAKARSAVCVVFCSLCID